MSWSLRLQYGDFVVNNASLGVATKQQKLVQDLRCAILEKMGTDNLHPSYGSLIDGGVTPDGVETEGIIGETDLDLAMLEVESEISRIARNHQREQLERAKRDKLNLGRATLDPEEVLIEITGLDFDQVEDALKVLVTLQTATGSEFELQLDVQVSPDLSEPI